MIALQCMLPITTLCSTCSAKLLWCAMNDGAKGGAAMNLCEEKVYVATGEHLRTRARGERINFTLMYSSLLSLAAGTHSHSHTSQKLLKRRVRSPRLKSLGVVDVFDEVSNPVISAEAQSH